MVIKTTRNGQEQAATLITGHAGTSSPEDVGHAQRTYTHQEPTMNGHETCERKMPGFPPLCGQPVTAHVVPGSGYPSWYACAEHEAAVRATGGQAYTKAEYAAIVSANG